MLQALKVDAKLISPFTVPLRERNVTQLRVAVAGDYHPLAELARRLGIAHALIVPLRHGSEIVGYHSLCSRRRIGRFTPQQEHLAEGIGQLGSLALENSRLLEQLQRADKLKTAFLASISQELPNPLNVIIGYHDMLGDDQFGALTDSQRGMLERADASARELLDLVINTLDISRFEATKVALDVEEIAVPLLIHEIEEETRAQTRKPWLDLEFHAGSEEWTLHTDRIKLRMVLNNLVANAVKYTQRGKVAVAAAWRNRGVEFAISDTGLGIPAEAREMIFEPFCQLEQRGNGPRDGAGLGLYIVRRMVDALGGTVKVESELGHGSTFRVWVPTQVRAVRKVA